MTYSPPRFPKWATPDPGAVDALVSGLHGDPFSILGPHRNLKGTWTVRAFMPGAEAVSLEIANNRDRTEFLPPVPMTSLHQDGLFGVILDGHEKDTLLPFYRLIVRWQDGPITLDDPYRFPALLGELDMHLLAEGRHLNAWETLGAQIRTLDGVEGCRFAVWAPHAQRVSVVGHFNHWDGRRHVMRLRHECGLWELFLPGVGPGSLYKFEIKSKHDAPPFLKSDPYAVQMEFNFGTASVVAAPSAHHWEDEHWMATRGERSRFDQPISIFEVHLGSWAREVDDGGRFLNWHELADRLVPYVQWLGFTHLELLPISEFPFDGSWGYQPLGLFAPTHRFGNPDGFRHFINRCHQHDIAVLVDWVPGHFPTDAHGLRLFDGTCLYEHEDPRQGFHPDWQTNVYNYGRTEVVNFLLANALYWLESFHVDGLRVDAVASMLYLDYSRKDGEWIPNRYGGNENLEAIDFFRQLNNLIAERVPGAVTMAEESTAWPQVSGPTHLGGLGFNFKWNMGWMNDTLEYMKKDPIFRRFHHGQLTFSQVYAYSERFVLPLSHDEVVHGKGSLLNKMPGDKWRKLANLRLLFTYQFTHPGKKLLFMGGEFAQEKEWNHDTGLDWDLLADEGSPHFKIREMIRDLNRLYRHTSALYRGDASPSGFQWIDCTDEKQSVLAFLRLDPLSGDKVAIVLNFTPEPRYHYRIGVPDAGRWSEKFNSDSQDYGGSNVGNLSFVETEDKPWHGRPFSLSVTLPPLAGIMLVWEQS